MGCPGWFVNGFALRHAQMGSKGRLACLCEPVVIQIVYIYLHSTLSAFAVLLGIMRIWLTGVYNVLSLYHSSACCHLVEHLLT